MLGFSAVSEVALGELPGDGAPPPATRTILRASTRASWNSPAQLPASLRAVTDPAQGRQAEARAAWAVGAKLDARGALPWRSSAASDAARRAPWGVYRGRAEPTRRSTWAGSAPRDQATGAPWGRYAGRAEPTSHSAWVGSAPSDHRAGAPWGGPMARLDLQRRARIQGSVPADHTQWAPWTKFSRTVTGGVGVFIPPDDGVPEPHIVVPVRRVYVTVNTIALRRVDGNISLPAFNMQLSLDRDSWVWSFSASLPADTLEYVRRDAGDPPVELEASVNGEQFRLLVDKVRRTRSFNKAAISVSGRGKLALLDKPYAAVRTFANDEARTLEQLMGDVLTENGVSLGYEIEFGPEDWLVPAGAFSHQGTYISALNTLAAAAGAYVQPHPTDDALQILPEYPVLPWDWLTEVDPDYELPAAVMTTEGIEWTDYPEYNRVFVSGTTQGVLGQVTRAGTAGDLVAELITDPLITTAAAARQRATPVLARTGRVLDMSLRLPVLADTGVIVPGKFVRYVDGGTTRIGIVRGVQLDLAMPTAYQTLNVETRE